MQVMKQILLSLFIISFFCCTTRERVQIDADTLTIEMDFDKTTSIHNMDIVDSIDILRLDNSVLLGQVKKVIRYRNYLYLFDGMTNTVAVYDAKGNLIKKIADIGQGPEEYLQPTDIFINQKENVLGIVSGVDRKLMKYDLDNFNLKAIERMPKNFWSFVNTENGYAGYMNNLIDDKPFNLWTMSQTLKLTNSFLEFPTSWSSNASGNIHPFSTYRGNTHHIQQRDFNVYSVDGNNIRIAYLFDLGKRTWPASITEYEDVEQIIKSSPDQYVRYLYMFQETQNYLIIKTVFNGKSLLGIYDKKSKISQVAEMNAYTDKYFISFGNIVGMDENAIYTLVDARRVKRNIIGKNEYADFESMYPIGVKNLREKFKDIVIEDDDNPFLIIHYFNK